MLALRAKWEILGFIPRTKGMEGDNRGGKTGHGRAPRGGSRGEW